jgi:hypothetical protein
MDIPQRYLHLWYPINHEDTLPEKWWGFFVIVLCFVTHNLKIERAELGGD